MRIFFFSKTNVHATCMGYKIDFPLMIKCDVRWENKLTGEAALQITCFVSVQLDASFVSSHTI